MRSAIIFQFFNAFVLIFMPACAYGYELLAGGAAYVERIPYRDESYNFIPFPWVQFESEYFYFDTSTAGLYVHKTDNTSLTLIADYFSMGFKPHGSDNDMMRLIDRRRPTVMAGVNFTAWGPYGIVRAQVLNDVLFQSEGARAKLAYMLYFKPREVHILPEAGVFWYSGMHNRYYYGVTSQEAQRSGFDRYRPDGSFTPYLAICAMYDITERIRVSIKADWFILPAEVKDSPITDKTNTGSVFLGLGYVF